MTSSGAALMPRSREMVANNTQKLDRAPARGRSVFRFRVQVRAALAEPFLYHRNHRVVPHVRPVFIGHPHNSLMPLELNGFRVHIESDGKELPQYQVKRVGATTTRCYIPSEAGKVGSGTSLRVAEELTFHDVHRATRSSRLSLTLHARLTTDSSRISWLKES